MLLYKCPNCAEFIHRDADSTVYRCWNCGAATDFSGHKTLEEKLVAACDRWLSRAIPPVSRGNLTGKIVLLAAMPIVVTMLLACNSTDISIVHQASESPDSWPHTNASGFDY